MSSMRTAGRLIRRAALLLLVLSSPIMNGRAASSAPPLTGTVVRVASESALQSAVRALRSNTTILVAPGTYRLTSTLWVQGALDNVAIRGDSENADDVVLIGSGMADAGDRLVPYGIWSGNGVRGLTIANLTVRDVYHAAILFDAGTEAPLVHNVHLVNAGDAFVMARSVNRGTVEHSRLEYTATARESGTSGVDVRAGAGWTVGHNVFRHLVAPNRQSAGPAVLAWNGSKDTTVEGNTFLDCSVGVAFGAPGQQEGDHDAGVIRNNMFARAADQPGGAAILVNGSADTQVVNNTVFASGTSAVSIGYRYPGAHGVVVADNLVDGNIEGRDGATAVEAGNVSGARAEMFANPAAGDLHLTAAAVEAIDRGVPVPAVSDDWDGEARPQGSAYDVGADEFVRLGAMASKGIVLGGRIVGADGDGVAAIVVTLSGARNATTTTNWNGIYSFMNLPARSDYVVRPSMGGYTFSPASLAFHALSFSMLTANFGAHGGNTPSLPTTPPSVILTEPSDGAAYQAPATITVRAEASGGGSPVKSVDFYANSSLIVRDTRAPYIITWRHANAGKYKLKAVVTNRDGISSTSSARTVTVTAPPPPDAPVVTLTAPSSGSVFSAPANVTLRAATRGGRSRVKKLDFYVNNKRVGGSSRSPFTMRWRGAGPGSYTLTAVATDTSSRTSTSTPVNVSVTSLAPPTNDPPPPSPTTPTVVLTSPAQDSSYTAPATITVTASANPGSGSITTVQFYASGVLIGSDTSAPYSVSWKGVAAGSYVLKAIANDSGGGSATSDNVNVTVGSVTRTPPTVTITAPTSSSTFVAPATVAIRADATGGSDSVVQVDFYAGATLIGTATSSPYGVTWPDVAAGTYALKAVVTNGAGDTATASRSLTVGASTPTTPTPPPPSGGSGRLLQVSDFVYQGSFKVPAGVGFEYGGVGIAYNPAHDSLFMVGHTWYQKVGEISIPPTGGTAKLLQPLVDATEGKLSLIGTTASDTPIIGGLWPTSDGKLIMAAYLYYDGSGQSAVASHFVRPADLGAKGQVKGPFKAGTENPGFYGGYFASIPSNWQAALGGPVLNGLCCIGIISRSSYGPAVFAMNPADVGTKTPIPEKPLLEYPDSHQTLGPWDSSGISNPIWNGETQMGGVVMPIGTDTVAFFGHQGMGPFCYGTGADCHDPVKNDKGVHGYPYSAYIWLYDAKELAEVKAGTKQPWDVKPYARGPLGLSGGSNYAQYFQIVGAAYDPSTGRIFLSQERVDGDNPVVHVLTVK